MITNCEFTEIDMTTPLETNILLYWVNSDHIEMGKLYQNKDSKLYHVLALDGERLNDEPTHWMHVPSVKIKM